MQRHSELEKKRRQNGLALPLAVIFLVIFAILVAGLLARFGGIGNKEYVQAKLDDKQYVACMAATRIVEYRLRQENPHLWTQNQTQTMVFNINGTSVTVKREDTTVN